ncbi:unnamed protein product [Symbiodinium sp. KB8]|nr:unnamed protein product [Symbiodinium sp. KB8]
MSPPSSLWTEAFGLHPSSLQWLATCKMMIRNVPARCTEQELRDFLDSLTSDRYSLQMPKTQSKSKGYAFVEMRNPVSLCALAGSLWQQCIPTRQSTRALKIHPAEPMKEFSIQEPLYFEL